VSRLIKKKEGGRGIAQRVLVEGERKRKVKKIISPAKKEGEEGENTRSIRKKNSPRKKKKGERKGATSL